MSLLQTLPLFFTIILSSNWLCTSSTTEFVFNANFSSSNLLLFGDSTIQKSSSNNNNNNNDNNILSLTNDSTTFSMGRALFPSKIPTNTTISFSTSFIFSISSVRGLQPGHGFAFLFTPSTGLSGASSSQHLGLFNLTNNGDFDNHVFAVEFDVFENQEFQDIDDNHVGLNVNSLTSSASEPAGYWVGEDDDDDDEFEEIELKNGVNYQVWIYYFDSRINVTMAPAGRKRPRRALISVSLNLSDVFLDEMYVGFTGATGQLVESHRILAWSFSTTNSSISDALVTQNLPSFVAASKGLSRGLVVGVSVSCVVVGCGLFVIVYVFLLRKKRSKSEDEEIGEWEKEYWPHRIEYREIHKATMGFSEENVIGFGGNGKVSKGVLAGGVEVAVKRISVKNEQGMREFLAEISSLGRLKHRNLVGLKGWCKREKGSLILVYDYMQNGSLDKRIFECSDSMLLTWEERVKVLKDVASGILYLHEGWEVKVLHRDVKASNVLLDKDMNARLGDFGLARMHHHGQLANTTRVVGTAGYMAPEVVKTGRASVQADVFGFGVLVLEVVSGRRPIQEGLLGLVDWVRRLMETGELVSALDERLKKRGGYDIEEVERVLYLGLACVSPQPNGRPTMGQVVKVLEGKGTSDGAIESEEEGMKVELLRRMRTAATTSSSSEAQWNSGGGGAHPTFEGIRNSISSSMSLNGSDIIRVSR